MKTRIASLGFLLLAACGGGGDSPAGGGGQTTNIYTGTITVTSAMAAGTTSCQGTTAVVRFKAAGGGADIHSVTVAGGGCVQFVNDDGADHRVAGRSATTGCGGLNAPAATPAGQSYTAGPLGAAAGPITCDWQDSLNPPGAGGGGY
ncbi:MAG: hypothetical protein HZB56_17095 [Deltaproteobacteria bacterium]|nr:hypothetical protein [Deltaproteobacteria bacterium]